MDSPKNGGEKTPTGHLSLPNETSSAKNGIHLVELLVKGAPWKAGTTQEIAKAPGGSP